MSNTDQISQELAEELGQTEQPSADLEVLATQAIAKVNEGGVDLAEILRMVTPAPPVPALPAQAPLPAVITEKQQAALDKLPAVFGKVVPHTVRKLTAPEIASLIEERETLDEIEKLAKDRKEKGIRVAAANHLDEVARETGEADGAFRDEKGHFVLAGKIPCPEAGKAFSREIRGGSPGISASDLEALMESGDLSKEDYLAMTTQTRVLDENKVMLRLRSNPDLVRALQKATRPTPKTASIYVRKL